MKAGVVGAVVVMVLLGGSLLRAQVPEVLNIQGRVVVNGTNFDGIGHFKFALVDGGSNLNQQATAMASVSGGHVAGYVVIDGGSGYVTAPNVSISGFGGFGSGASASATVSNGSVATITLVTPGSGYVPPLLVHIDPPPANLAYQTLWSHDVSSGAGGEPTTSITLPVRRGLYSVQLGDPSLSNMIAGVWSTVFRNPDVRLRVWFDGGSGFVPLTPDQRVAPVGYAMMAAAVADNAITSGMLSPGAVQAVNIANGAVGTAQLASGAVTSDTIANGAVGTAQLGSGAVTAGTIANGAVGTAQLASGAVTADTIASGAVGSSQLATGAVTATAIASGAVGSSQLAKPPRGGRVCTTNLMLLGSLIQHISYSPACATVPIVMTRLESDSPALTSNNTLIVRNQAATGFDWSIQGSSEAAGKCVATLTTQRPAPYPLYQTSGYSTNEYFSGMASAAQVGGGIGVSFAKCATLETNLLAFDPYGPDYPAQQDVTSRTVLAYGYVSNFGDSVSNGPDMVIDNASDVATNTSLAVVGGKPAISYQDASRRLRFIRATTATGSAWGSSTLVDNSAGAGLYSSMALLGNGYPAIAYYHAGLQRLRFVVASDTNGTSWSPPANIQSGGDVGRSPILAIVSGAPAIFYVNTTSQTLCYVQARDATGTTWRSPVTLDTQVVDNCYGSLAMIAGRPALSYCDKNKLLKYIIASDAMATNWPDAVVVTNSIDGPSFLYLQQGVPVVSYSAAGSSGFGFLSFDFLIATSSDLQGSSWRADRFFTEAVHSDYVPQTMVSGTLLNGLPYVFYSTSRKSIASIFGPGGNASFIVNWIAIEL